MTENENYLTNTEICAPNIDFDNSDEKLFAVITPSRFTTYLIPKDQIAFILYMDPLVDLSLQVNQQPIEIAKDSAWVIWSREDTELKSIEPPNSTALLLSIPIMVADRWDLDGSINSYGLDNRSQILMNDIISKQDDISIKRFLRASQWYELLYLQLSNILTNNNTKQNTYFEKAALAKKTIDEDMSRNRTIPELAKIVGTNEQYLKTYFKQCYNKTISQYSIETKMECAKKLIMAGNCRIADVARMTGYKHPTHFTTAFKKYFGYKPNLLK